MLNARSWSVTSYSCRLLIQRSSNLYNNFEMLNVRTYFYYDEFPTFDERLGTFEDGIEINWKLICAILCDHLNHGYWILSRT